MSLALRSNGAAAFRERLTLAGLRRAVDELGNHGSGSWSWRDIVQACGDLRALPEARKVHSRIVSSGYGRDVILCNHMVNMYVRCGSIEEARLVFDSITEKDVVLWTAMISAYSQRYNGGQDALHLFRRMQQDGIAPDSVTFNAVLGACATTGSCNLVEGRALYERVAELGLLHDHYVGSSVLNMYGKCGDLETATTIFRKMNTRQPVPWNVMITVYTQGGHCEKAIQLFREMLLEAVEATSTTYVTVLNACNILADGRQVHALINEAGFDRDIVAATAVMNMYGKCGRPQEALGIFNEMPERNTVTWNAIMNIFSQQQGPSGLVVQLFRRMLLEGQRTSEVTFLAVVSTLNGPELYPQAKLLHTLAQEVGYTWSIVVSTAIMDMYSYVERLEDAERVFDSLEHKDVFAWNSMISAYIQGGHEKQAVELFFRMQSEGLTPDAVSLVTVLGACSTPEALPDGRAIHSSIHPGLEEELSVATALVTMYGKCGSAVDARKVFDKTEQRSLVTWNAMLSVYSQKEQGGAEALLFFQNMQLQGVVADYVTMVTLLTACSRQGSLIEGKKVHSYLLERWRTADALVESALLNMYSKCGGLQEAWRLFINMPAPGLSSWNTIISAYARHGSSSQALKLFYQMQQGGIKPSMVTFVSVLTGCSHAGLSKEGLNCFSSMVHDYGIQPSVDHAGCVIDLLARLGLLQDAEDFIRRMPADQPNSVVWMTVLGAGNVQGELANVRRAVQRVVKLEK